MACGVAVLGIGGSIVDGPAILEAGSGSALVEPATPELAAQQVAPPAAVVGALQLGVDEAIDGLVADDRTPRIESEAAGDLLGRPSLGEAVEDVFAQRVVALET